MPTRVVFRFNKRTGEVEEFLVDDQARQLSELEHDRIARAVAGVVAVDARITEVLPQFAGSRSRPIVTSEGETEPESETREERRRE